MSLIDDLMLNDFANLALDNLPSDFSIGKIMSVQGSTLTLGVPNAQGGLFSIPNVQYLNSFVPTAGATCWYRNINGSVLVFGQQASRADGPRSKLVTLLGTQTSWAQGAQKTLLRSISGTNLIIVKWKTPYSSYDVVSLTGAINRLGVANTSDNSDAYSMFYVGDLSFSGNTATLIKAAAVEGSIKTRPDSRIFPYQIYALL